jgi:hypothetical protein
MHYLTTLFLPHEKECDHYEDEPWWEWKRLCPTSEYLPNVGSKFSQRVTVKSSWLSKRGSLCLPCRLLLAWLTRRPRTWRRYVPPKCRWTSTRPHGFISQKTVSQYIKAYIKTITKCIYRRSPKRSHNLYVSKPYIYSSWSGQYLFANMHKQDATL